MDLISRQAAIDALADYIHNVDRVYSTGKLTHEDCMDAAHSVLDELPSAQPTVDAVPVVRCRDCKYRDRESDFCYGRGLPVQLVPDDGFCDKGKGR